MPSPPAAVSLRLRLLPGAYAVCRLAPADTLPAWAALSPVASQTIWSVVRTPDETSIVCEQTLVPAEVQAERNWCLLQLEGPMPFSLTGILAAVLNPLAAAGIGIFALSTFDTDYVLVKQESRDAALNALTAAGHVIL